MKKIPSSVAMGALIGLLSAPFAFAEDSCASQSLALKGAIASAPSDLLQLVEAKVSASPGCSCEIVKTAIEVTQADAKTVAAIVRVASSASPDQMRLIAQCALAVAPDALADVQAVLAELDPNGGKSGTVKNMFKNSEESYVFAKSGSLGGVYNLSGYIITKKGKTLLFSLMNNNFNKPTSQIRKEVEKILIRVREIE